jgi:hypothetical protein
MTCPDCGYLPDTPNHEIGCARGRDEYLLSRDPVKQKAYYDYAMQVAAEMLRQGKEDRRKSMFKHSRRAFFAALFTKKGPRR